MLFLPQSTVGSMQIDERILEWYDINKRDLPWRNTKNPYYIWLSEIILQQTRVAQGYRYYQNFITKFPTIYDLANASEQEVLHLWQGLGYYSRARNLYTTACDIVKNRDGEFPDSYGSLLQLKGIGPYTAAAIASICFGEKVAAIDGNVYRLLSRFYDIHLPIYSSQGKKHFQELANKLIKNHNPNDFNQAMIEFGALQCIPKPDCINCPLHVNCKGYKNQTHLLLPKKNKKAKPKNRNFHFLILMNSEGETFLDQRTSDDIWKHLYQFPLIEGTGKLTKKEIITFLNNYESIYNIREDQIISYKKSIHKLTHQTLHLKFWLIKTPHFSMPSISFSECLNLPLPQPLYNVIDAFIKEM